MKRKLLIAAVLLIILLGLGSLKTAWAGPAAQTVPSQAPESGQGEEEPTATTEPPTATPETPTPTPTSPPPTPTPTATFTPTAAVTFPGAFLGQFAGLPVWLWLCGGLLFIFLLLPFIIWVLHNRKEEQPQEVQSGGGGATE